jgi:hypothetical protein
VQQHEKLQLRLKEGRCRSGSEDSTPSSFGLDSIGGDARKSLRVILQSAFATSSLHLHARIASLLGQAFYTIGTYMLLLTIKQVVRSRERERERESERE